MSHAKEIINQAINEVYQEQLEAFNNATDIRKSKREEYNQLLTCIREAEKVVDSSDEIIGAKKIKAFLKFNLIVLGCLIVSIAPLGNIVHIASIIVNIVNLISYFRKSVMLSMEKQTYPLLLSELKKKQDKTYNELNSIDEKIKDMRKILDYLEKLIIENTFDELKEVEVIKLTEEEQESVFEDLEQGGKMLSLTIGKD